MSGRWAVVKRKCTFVGGFDTASHPSIVQMAWTQVLPLAGGWSRKKGWVSLASHRTTLGLNLSFGEMAIPIRTHPNQNTSVSGAWGLTTENQNLENVLPFCCTPISSGWKHQEDIKGIRSAIHNVFTWKKMTALKFSFLWTTSEWPSHY